ncbi:AMP-dependent synthetase/ligase [Chloropicon primus]|nr:AMP-dependent synthetase/ligase [Chloropicon primus]
MEVTMDGGKDGGCHLVALMGFLARHGSREEQVFVDEDGREARVTSREVWSRSGGIAEKLRKWGAKKGDTVLLVYPPGLEFVAALIACFRLGVTAVPAYPPNPKNLEQQAKVLGSIAKDAGASIALTDSSFIWVARYAATYTAGASFGRSARQWMRTSRLRWGGQTTSRAPGAADEMGYSSWPVWVRWYSTSGVKGCDTFEDELVTGTDVAFLQYTSGSTSAPKGVMITYAALSHNIWTMIRISGHSTVLFDKLQEVGVEYFSNYPKGESIDHWIEDVPGTIVSWLPQYHDMGLIGHLLTPLLIPGMKSVRMSPFTFLKNPLAWAEAITKYQATVITAPDFGYSQLVKYAVAKGKRGNFQVAEYDFSHLRLALNGAGMIKYKTMRDFYFLFRHAGLPNSVFGGGFGLAEHCVYVTHGGETVLFVDRDALSQGQVIIKSSLSHESETSSSIDDFREQENIVSLCSCGKVNRKDCDIDVSIVDPSDCTRVASGCIGEIWISSPSKTGGYWNKEEETWHTFHARIKGEKQNTAAERKEYLRTGDLGFVWQNELYFVSRMKDLIVVHGRNIIPDDVEFVISQSHRMVRTGCVAAFQTEEDVMCAVAEVRSGDLSDEEIREITNQVLSSTRKHNMSLHSLQLIKPRTIPKTTSGKVRRSECRKKYLDNNLDVVQSTTFTMPVDSLQGKNLNLDALPSLGFSDAKIQILDNLLVTVRAMGLEVSVRDNLMDSGMDSSLMVALHNSLEDLFGCDLPPSVLLDHGTLDGVAQYVTSEIFEKAGVMSVIDVQAEGELMNSSNKAAAGLKRRMTQKSVMKDVPSLCMTFYMPTIFFLKLHDSQSKTEPMNLQGSEYFVTYSLFTLAIFLQSFVVFGLCRALALMDGVEPPKDVLLSFLRSSVSVQTHWNNFHVSWRQFFFRYIVMQHKETFQRGYVIDFAVFMFSAFLHSEPIWVAYFLYNFFMYQFEKVLLKWKRFKDGDAVVRGVYQSILLAANLSFFPPLLLYEEPRGSIKYSSVGPAYFFLFSVCFCYFNCIRIKNYPDQFI